MLCRCSVSGDTYVLCSTKESQFSSERTILIHKIIATRLLQMWRPVGPPVRVEVFRTC